MSKPLLIFFSAFNLTLEINTSEFSKLYWFFSLIVKQLTLLVVFNWELSYSDVLALCHIFLQISIKLFANFTLRFESLWNLYLIKIFIIFFNNPNTFAQLILAANLTKPPLNYLFIIFAIFVRNANQHCSHFACFLHSSGQIISNRSPGLLATNSPFCLLVGKALLYLQKLKKDPFTQWDLIITHCLI